MVFYLFYHVSLVSGLKTHRQLQRIIYFSTMGSLQRVVNKKGNENDEIIDIANSTQQSVRVAPNRFKIVEKLAGKQSGLVRMKKNLSSSFVKMRPVLMIRLKNIQSDDTKHC